MITEEEIESIVIDNLREELRSYVGYRNSGKKQSYDAATALIRIKLDLNRLGINETEQRILN